MASVTASTQSVHSQSSDAKATVGHENGVDTTTNGQPQEANGGGDAAQTEPEGGYPPQRHAGAVGYGPQYAEMHSAVGALCSVEPVLIG